MAELHPPLEPEEFALLMRRAGLDLPAAEVEELRLAHPRLRVLLDRLRAPANTLAAEPAFTFAVHEDRA
jgi:hypothetical protein